MIRANTRGDEAAAAVEYAIMVSLVFMVVIASVTLFGINLAALFADAAEAMP